MSSILTKEDLAFMTVVKLKELAKSKGIPSSAKNKSELVEKIWKALKQEHKVKEISTTVAFEDFRKLTKNKTFSCKVGTENYIVENNQPESPSSALRDNQLLSDKEKLRIVKLYLKNKKLIITKDGFEFIDEFIFNFLTHTFKQTKNTDLEYGNTLYNILTRIGGKESKQLIEKALEWGVRAAKNQQTFTNIDLDEFTKRVSKIQFVNENGDNVKLDYHVIAGIVELLVLELVGVALKINKNPSKEDFLQGVTQDAELFHIFNLKNKSKTPKKKKKENVEGTVKKIDDIIIQAFNDIFDEETSEYNMYYASVNISISKNDNVKIKFDGEGGFIEVTPSCDGVDEFTVDEFDEIKQALKCIQKKIKPKHKITITGYPYYRQSLEFQHDWSKNVLNVFVKFFHNYCGLNNKNIIVRSMIDDELVSV